LIIPCACGAASETSAVVHSGASRVQNVIALFFMVGWDWYGFNKKRARTSYTQLLFFNSRGSVGHVVHSGASGRIMLRHYFSCSGGPSAVFIKSALGHVTPNLCFASYGICGSRSPFRCVWCVKHDRTIFHAQVRLVQIRQKVHRDTLCQTCVFSIRWNLWVI
jgi:hypothetical protein